jgi:hypothetical protein
MNALRTAFLATALATAGGSHAQPIGPSAGSGLAGEHARASDRSFASATLSSFQGEDLDDPLFDTPGVDASPLAWTDGVNFADIAVSEETDEDRFFGAIDPLGISAIRISNGGNGTDPLQYRIAAARVPEIHTIASMIGGLSLLGFVLRRRGLPR